MKFSETKKAEVVNYAKENTNVKAAKKYGVHEITVSNWRTKAKRAGRRIAAKKYLASNVLPAPTEVPSAEDAVKWALYGYAEGVKAGRK